MAIQPFLSIKEEVESKNGSTATHSDTLCTLQYIFFSSDTSFCQFLCGREQDLISNPCPGIVNGCGVADFDYIVELEEDSNFGTEIFVTEEMLKKHKGNFMVLIR